nr:hypothetical protein [Tanacetum cinerariifolium]
MSRRISQLPPSMFLLDFSSSAIFTAVASLFFWQWELSSLAVGTFSASGNSITGKDAFNRLFVLDDLLSCGSLKSSHLPSESSFPLEACNKSSQLPDPSSEASIQLEHTSYSGCESTIDLQHLVHTAFSAPLKAPSLYHLRLS